jgi:hypothetical protein
LADSEFSTVDTAEMAMGALFAGNYFGDEVMDAAVALVSKVQWPAAIEEGGGPTTYPIINVRDLSSVNPASS